MARTVPSQMGIEDVALACSLPGVQVLVPADEVATHLALQAAIEYTGPVYMRVGRGDVPVVYESADECPFALGKAIRVRDGSDVTIVANGLMVAAAVDAHRKLASRGISARVLDMASVKPLDTAALLDAAAETGALVVAEEHLAHGGLGSVVAMALAQARPTPLEFVNVGDRYAESGSGDALLVKYGLTGDDLVAARRACPHPQVTLPLPGVAQRMAPIKNRVGGATAAPVPAVRPAACRCRFVARPAVRPTRPASPRAAAASLDGASIGGPLWLRRPLFRCVRRTVGATNAEYVLDPPLECVIERRAKLSVVEIKPPQRPQPHQT